MFRAHGHLSSIDIRPFTMSGGVTPGAGLLRPLLTYPETWPISPASMSALICSRLSILGQPPRATPRSKSD